MSEPHIDLSRIDAYDYQLPDELIAQTPLEPRDASRLMIVDPSSGTIVDSAIRELPRFLLPGDLLVVNNTRVMPARIHAKKHDTGGRVELLLLHRDPSGIWTCLAKPAKALRPGQTLTVVKGDGTEIAIEVVEKRDDGEFLVRIGIDADRDLDSIGAVPLPPYIKAPLESIDRYQTLYARVPGSAAAPTAGLHITPGLRDRLAMRGVNWAEVTLHIGLDTFRPVTASTITEHRIHSEWCSLSRLVAAKILETKSAGGRVIAVGTTSARTLESWATYAAEQLDGGYEGWSQIFITPGYDWKAVNGLLTNFHLPRSTLLMMVSSLASRSLIMRAYEHAIDQRYRFFSFGDAMLILPGVATQRRRVDSG